MSQHDPHDATAQLLRRSESGIRAYLLCRVGDPEQARGIYEEVRAQLASGDSGHLTSAPTLRAVAYATARELTLGRGRGANADDILARVPWLAAEGHTGPRYVEFLDQVRSHLPARVAEVLELRHARTLELPEIAYVVGLSESQVKDSLAAGEDSVRTLAGPLSGLEVAVSAMVSDAFRADTSSKERHAERIQTGPPRLREGTVIAERFEIVSTLASQRAVSSFLANDRLAPGDTVVVHVLGKPAVTIAARNGLLGKLRRMELTADPSIERTLTYGWLENRLWYATPWYRGQTLADLIADGALSLSEAAAVLQPIWRGLAALHERGIVHRNVSPRNIRLVQVGAAGSHETHSILCGADGWLTGDLYADDEPEWVSPEVAQKLLSDGRAGAGATSEDVFSLALTTLHALVPRIGQRSAQPYPELLAARASEPIPVPESASLKRVRPLFDKALTLEASDRPEASEIDKRLSSIQEQTDPDKARRRMVWALAAGALALALFAFVYFVRESRRDLLNEAIEGAEMRVQQQELEAEQERSQELELRLNQERPPSAGHR